MSSPRRMMGVGRPSLPASLHSSQAVSPEVKKFMAFARAAQQDRRVSMGVISAGISHHRSEGLGEDGLMDIDMNFTMPKRRLTDMSVNPRSFPPSLNSSAQGMMSDMSGRSRTEADGSGGKGRSRKDLGQIDYVQALPISRNNTKICTVQNGITDETVVVISGGNVASIYRLKCSDEIILDSENESTAVPPVEEILNTGTTPKKMRFELEKLQDVELQNEKDHVECFAISPLCSITLPPRNLIYAISPSLTKFVYYLRFKETDFELLPETVVIKEDDLDSVASWMTVFDQGHQAQQIVIKNDQFMACLLDNFTAVVWDVYSKSKICTFHVASLGVHLSWHPNENFKLFVADAVGNLNFYNIVKERCYLNHQTFRSPTFSGDWALSNSQYAAIGWAGGISIVDVSQSNTNTYKHHFHSCQVIKRISFNPTDHRTFVTFSGPAGTIRVWNTNQSHHLWSHTDEKLQDVAWMVGKPYVLGLGYKDILVFDSTTAPS